MAPGARVLHHLKAFAPASRIRSHSSATKSLALASHAPSIKINDEYAQARASVKSIFSLSAHRVGLEHPITLTNWAARAWSSG
jgi:metallo-beta-lactamase family protein